MNAKVFVIGLDGATFELIKPWIEEGALPTLKTLIDKGVHGNLTSTIPFITCPAWTSFKTGMNPGKTGVFDFFARVPNSYKTRPRFQSLQGKSIWDILSKKNMTVGIINVPTTYPPHRVQGFMVTGMLTPSQKKEFTYPKNLRKDLDRVTGGYLINIDRLEYLNEDQFLEDLYKLTEKRIKAVKYVLEKYSPDFFMVVFVGTDRIQHFFWKYLDETHPLYDEGRAQKYRNEVKNYWIKIDSAIKDIVDTIDEHTYVIIMSDHGFGSQKKNFYINDWLEKKGFLTSKEEVTVRGFTRESVKNVLRKLGVLKYVKTLPISKGRKLLPTGRYPTFEEVIPKIDWSNTKAYSCQHSFDHIYLNVKGRDPHGSITEEVYESVRNDLIDELKIFGEETALPVKVYKREEIYTGAHVSSAPDIIFLLKEGECLTVKKVGHSSVVEDGSFKEMHTGSHRPHGILITYGPHIKKGVTVDNAEIIDIVPTILHIYGIPIPQEMDGTVLKAIFEEHSELAKREVKYQKVDEEAERIKGTIAELKRTGKV